MPCATTKLPTETRLTRSRDEGWAMPLTIDTVGRDGSLVLVVKGELDITTSHLLDEALDRARDTDAISIVVDLSAVGFIDSTALHVLIRHASGSERPRRVCLTKGSPQVQRVFELSGVLPYLSFVSE